MEVSNPAVHPDILSVNVVFACDRNYVQHLAVALYSLFENNRDLSIDVYVLNTDLEQAAFDKLSLIAARFGQKIFGVNVPLHEVEGLVTGFHFTPANYFRLFIPEKLPFSRVLYLDSDIVVNGSIRDLCQIELDDYYLAGVREPHFQRHAELEMSEDACYFNSGVMVINLPKWRSDHIKERVIEFVKRKPEAVILVDQCGTNSVINGKWKSVHPKYNVVSAFFEEDYLSHFSDLYPRDELAQAINDPVIIHYTGSAKPWILRRPHRYRHLYWHYSRKTPFRRYLPEGLTVSRALGLCLKKVGVTWNNITRGR